MIPLAYHAGQTEHLSDLRAGQEHDEPFTPPPRLPNDCGEKATLEILRSVERAVESRS